MEKAYSLIRMELREEEEEKKVKETENNDKNLEQRMKETEAKTRRMIRLKRDMMKGREESLIWKSVVE